MFGQVVLVSAIGGLIALDKSAAFQFMISRPIVTGPIIGWLLGDAGTGAIIGALLELLWISSLPLGGFLPPNACLATITSTAGVILSGLEPGGAPLIVLSILTAPMVAAAGAALETKNRSVNGFLLEKAKKAVKERKSQRIVLYNLVGVVFSYILLSLFLFIMLYAVTGILYVLYPAAPPPMIRALETMYPFIPLIGVAAALKSMDAKYSPILFSLSFLGVFLLLHL